jgi:hypothetical protein
MESNGNQSKSGNYTTAGKGDVVGSSDSKVAAAAKEAGCELTQLGNTEVFYCPEHVGVNQQKDSSGKSGDSEIDDMVDSGMHR